MLNPLDAMFSNRERKAVAGDHQTSEWSGDELLSGHRATISDSTTGIYTCWKV